MSATVAEGRPSRARAHQPRHTHCRNGHEHAVTGVRIVQRGKHKGQRVCLECERKEKARVREREAIYRVERWPWGPSLSMVPNEPLRERYLYLRKLGKVSPAEMAKAMGCLKMDNKMGKRVADTRDLDRRLGIKPSSQRGEPQYRKTVSYDWAVKAARFLNMDPHEAGV